MRRNRANSVADARPEARLAGQITVGDTPTEAKALLARGGISIEPLWARLFDFGAGRVPSFLLSTGVQ